MRSKSYDWLTAACAAVGIYSALFIASFFAVVVMVTACDKASPTVTVVQP